MDSLYLTQAVNKQKNQFGNIIPLVYIKNKIFMIKFKKNPRNWDKEVAIACITLKAR